MPLKLLSIKPANDGVKKYVATFSHLGKEKSVKFGALGMSDFTINKDEERKQRYLKRHAKNESWNQPDTPGALSRWILWNKPTIRESISDFKNRFNL